jgi:hypothetical protein
MRRVLLALTMCLFVASTAQAQYSGGSGAAADLIALGETHADYDKHFILTGDIDLDPNLPGRKVFDRAVVAPPESLDEWGYFQGTAFTGVFDGDGHRILRLMIHGGDYLGLFGGWAGEVKNLGVVAVNVVASGYYLGGLVGHNGGTVTQCFHRRLQWQWSRYLAPAGRRQGLSGTIWPIAVCGGQGPGRVGCEQSGLGGITSAACQGLTMAL